MKHFSLICATALACFCLTGCGTTQSKSAKLSSEANSLKAKNSSLKAKKRKAHKMAMARESHKKAAKASQSVSNVNNTSNNSQAKGNAQPSSESQQSQSQDNDTPAPPEGVDPNKWAEHDAYTSDGHLMRQWNDAGKYEGDPDAQYHTQMGQNGY